jgi:hypothetical protein
LRVSLEAIVPASRFPAVEKLLNKTAADIMDNKSREMWKAYGAVFFTVANIVFAMIPPAAPGSQTVSGATIAATLVLAPLLLIVLLSNAIGEHKSLPTLHNTIKHFLKELEELKYPMVNAGTMTNETVGNTGPGVGASLSANVASASADRRETHNSQSHGKDGILVKEESQPPAGGSGTSLATPRKDVQASGQA